MNANDLILTPGLEGSFELAPPFTNKIRANARYTIRSSRMMSAIISAGENPQTIYNDAGVPESEYLRDLQLDVCIIRLHSDAGEWVDVPQSYIVSLPKLDGVSYRPLALVAPLGMTPDDKDLANLLAAVNALVMEHLGVQSDSAVAAVGAAELVAYSEHDRITAERKARVTYSESEAARMVRLQRENAELKAQNLALAEHVRKLS